MENIEFKNLKITTITMICELIGQINLSNVFHLAPITKIVNFTHSGAAKCKLPYGAPVGSIISMRYDNMVRGIMTSQKNFKNSITLTISTSTKNISIKLSDNTIHLCGASNKNNANEAIELILEHIYSINDNIIRFKNDANKDLIEWISYHFKGSPTEKCHYRIKEFKNMNLKILTEIPDFFIKKPDNIPENFDHKLIDFLYNLSKDLIYHSDFMNKIKNIKNFNASQSKLYVEKKHEVMVNYNYNLGFNVNRIKLNELVDGKNGFLSRFDNANVNHVKIELPYKLQNYNSRKTNKKIPHHSFLIYKSGAVTQSGPGGEIMEDAFYKFKHIIQSIKDQIII